MLCWMSSSATHLLLLPLFSIFYMSMIAHMGFKLIRQATERCQNYLPRPPPLPDPCVHPQLLQHIITIPPIVSVWLLWFVSSDSSPAILQLTGFSLAASLVWSWLRSCCASVGYWMDKFGCRRDTGEIEFYGDKVVPSPSSWAIDDTGQQLYLNFTIVIGCFCPVMVQLLFSLLRGFLVFIVAACLHHCVFLLGSRAVHSLILLGFPASYCLSVSAASLSAPAASIGL